MAKINVYVEEFARVALPALRSPGLLLVSACERDRPNVMTIGWGLIGTLWGCQLLLSL